MNRRNFVRSAALVPFASGSIPSVLAAQLAPDPLPRIEKGKAPAVAATALQERYEMTLQRVLSGGQPAYDEAFVLEDVTAVPGRRFTEYSGDVSGRYIGALSSSSRVYGTHFPGLDALVVKVIALQKPDGYFGSGFHYEKPGDLDMALLWGNGRLLVGLVEYYRLRPTAEVLAACRRLGDFLVKVGPLMLSREIREEFGAQHFASSYICWTQQTEGLANLYQVTKDERYRKLAEAIVAVTERRAADHAHGYLSSIRGWVDLYSVTHDPALLAKCESAWEDVAQSKDLLITGGVPEGWSPNNHRTEGCAEVDWLRLSLGLWRATGNPRYLAMAERSVFNEFAFNQFASGDFGHRVYTETGLPAGGAVRAWWCCSLHGLRCFPAVYEGAFRETPDGLSYDLPVDGGIAADGFAAVAESSLERDGVVKITIRNAPKAARTLRIRRPDWAQNVAVEVNGVATEAVGQDGFARVLREWRAGDKVTVKYGMSLRKETAGHQEAAEKERVAFWYGPWLLGAPASENAGYFNELTSMNKLTKLSEGSPEGVSVAAVGLSVPVAARVFHYVPAEFPEQPGKVTLRAIAEQAGQATTSWELRFLAEGEALHRS